MNILSKVLKIGSNWDPNIWVVQLSTFYVNFYPGKNQTISFKNKLNKCDRTNIKPFEPVYWIWIFEFSLRLCLAY